MQCSITFLQGDQPTSIFIGVKNLTSLPIIHLKVSQTEKNSEVVSIKIVNTSPFLALKNLLFVFDSFGIQIRKSNVKKMSAKLHYGFNVGFATPRRICTRSRREFLCKLKFAWQTDKLSRLSRFLWQILYQNSFSIMTRLADPKTLHNNECPNFMWASQYK